jgi:2-polyprenyl-3-methyl-5-hydroxy-6-metoxy-1,4-benzoquinol methylase
MNVGARRPSTSDVAVALARVRDEVIRSDSVRDGEYFARHEARFRQTLARFREVVAPGARVLDVGSHLLHQGAALSELGYSVVGVDVPVFAALDLVTGRSREFHIENHAVEFDAIARGEFLPGRENSMDAVFFCEVLEHITFNPIAFWRRIHELLRVDGVIYITTPNAFNLLAVLSGAYGLVTGRRLGLRVAQILEHVTYGHHWKEYSAWEIRRYFAMLSPDFAVRVHRFHFGDAPDPFPGAGSRMRLLRLVRRVGNLIPPFAEQLEAIVTLKSRTPWLREPPAYS